MRVSPDSQAANESSLEYQARALALVSRTFALTIPQLPAPVRHAVGNAYLLCRIADTIEDEPALDPGCKRLHLHRFADVVQGKAPVDAFVADLAPLLSEATNDGERELVANAGLVLGLHRQMPPGQRGPIERCVREMCGGMAEYVETGADGLRDMAEVDRYCHYVAGVVGEMLTDLFCDYSVEIASRREALFPLSSQFGRGLQLVNILKDHREDRLRGVGWLPSPHQSGSEPEGRRASVRPSMSANPWILRLVDVARFDLEAALCYVLLFPGHELGIRRFLAWTLGFAALTLRRIHANPGFSHGDEVKIPRRQVYGMVAATNVAVRSNRLLRWLLAAAAPPLPDTTPSG